MMTATVETPVVVEVDEVYQGLATGLAGKTSLVPAALLSCSGCKYSIFPWPQLFPALRGWGWGGGVLADQRRYHPPSFPPDFPTPT